MRAFLIFRGMKDTSKKTIDRQKNLLLIHQSVRFDQDALKILLMMGSEHPSEYLLLFLLIYFLPPT